MKFNFWQILGIVLVILGVVLVARKRTSKTDTVPPDAGATNPPAATTQVAPDAVAPAPATSPAATAP